MKRFVAFVVAAAGAAGVAGVAQPANAQGRLEWQVSPALQENWSSSINAVPGQSIDLRLRITYTGTGAAFGLGSVFFQPAISNWDTSGAGMDALLPFVATGGRTTPPGDVPDSPGVYGRISPYGWRFPANGDYTGFHNTVSGVSYLRIAQATASNWIGEPGIIAGPGVNAG